MAERRGGARLTDVAQEAGVTAKTVSQVLNGIGRARPETRERVLAAAERLGYRPNPHARRLAAGRSGVVALVLDRLGTGDEAALASAVVAAAETRGLRVVFQPTGGDAARRRELREQGDGVADGVILVGDPEGPGGLPAVGITDAAGPAVPGVAAVLRDRRAAVDVARRHLDSTGRSRIADLSDGLADGLADPGALADPGGLAAAAERARALLASPDRPDAVVIDLHLAPAVLRAARDRGLDVPGDLAVVGIGVADEAEVLVPALTTVGFPAADVATAAVRLLDALVDGGSAARTTIDPVLIHRASS